MNIFRKFRELIRLLNLLADLHREVKDLPTVDSLQTFLARQSQACRLPPGASTLDLGCGTHPKNPFAAQHVHGLDIRADEARNIRYADLTVEGIPHADAEFDSLTAYDFLEHVPRVVYLPTRRFPFVELMNEVWRVLKPGGLFLTLTPFFPFPQAYRDPTHVNLITPETFPLYFDNQQRMAAIYGFRGSFEVLAQCRQGYHLICLMRKAG